MQASSNRLTRVLVATAQSHYVWWFYLLGSFALLGEALVYQYVFDELPCVLCIHVRLWLSVLILVSVMGLLSHKQRRVNAALHLLTVVVAVGLIERSWQLLGNERGFILGECNFDLGLPVWLAVEQWLPWLYQVETTCGYTPEILFGITMAEALLVMSAGMVLVTLALFIVAFAKRD